MDKIELVVTHHACGPVDRLWSAVFGMAGGTIGRAGQNKLVLPDSDAEVARVHAMVRLDSDRAYIANLCERRSMLVNGIEVLSGQEVPLLPGADVGIGPYQLRAFLPGVPKDKTVSHVGTLSNPGVNAPPSKHTPGTLCTGLNSSEATPLNLAALPNPWADIPTSVGGESCMPELAALRLTDQSAAPPDASLDNPFAMLGRVATTDDDSPAQDRTLDRPQMHQIPGADSVAERNRLQSFTESPSVKHTSTGKSPRSQVPDHRAMVIPHDFDPFAADPNALSNSEDAWSGNLAAKSLAEVAQLKNDELLQSLPQTGQVAGDMDNAAHAGLPKGLDPTVELDPMKLFREPGEPMCGMIENYGLSRGSDLAQVFNMPREVRSGTRSDPAIEKTDPLLADSNAAESAIAAGLQLTQGLDIARFGHDAPGRSPDVAPQNVCDANSAAYPPPLSSALGTSVSNVRETSDQEFANQVQPNNNPSSIDVCCGSDHHASTDFGSEAPCQRLTNPARERLASERLDGEADVSPSMQALATAFLEGAGITPGKVKLYITPEFMHGFGEALRTAVQGSIDLLSARSEIKREFRADVTIIASGANNPLKFLPTADGVMLQLTDQTFPGFMKPVPAMKEAYKDLAVHQLALMTGIRAAYAEAIARLSPVELEKSAAASPSVLSKISTVHRKAALWDDYQKRYESIRRHAEDDLMAFSGKTFVEAYENAAKAAEGTL